MGQISEALQNLRPSFTEIMNPSLELIKNQNAQVNIGSADHHGILGFSSGTFLHHQQSQLLINLTDDFGQESRTLKSMPGIDSFVDLSSPLESGTGFIGKDKSLSGRKRKRKNIIDVKKPKDVIHVRAKRGEATDSHSLAERVRREKINERLRCLQDLVPGCYKTMGIAVMLDVIINYVQSLHNQIEFLSMKLSAASMCYDFNTLEMDSTESWQGPNPCEVQEMEMLIKEGYGGSSCFHSTWP